MIRISWIVTAVLAALVGFAVGVFRRCHACYSSLPALARVSIWPLVILGDIVVSALSSAARRM